MRVAILTDVDQAATALVRLNLETRAFHDAADQGWLGLLAPDVTHSDYLRQLVSVFGFEGPLEAAFAYTPHLKLFIELRQRSRAGLLAKDLLALGLRAQAVSLIPQCLLAPFSGPVEALGWMYVAERATLLHERVRRHLVKVLPDGPDVCAYVGAYEGVVGARWNELGRTLDRAVRTEARMDDLIAAARAGFRTLLEWSRTATIYARGA